MPMIGNNDDVANGPVLDKFRSALRALYGDRIERIVLFGSRARGDAHVESDYDVAVFLHGVADRSLEVHRLAEIQTDMLDETDAFFHAIPFPAGAWTERTPLMHEIRSEGRDL
jgi:uncharacterized protein